MFGNLVPIPSIIIHRLHPYIDEVGNLIQISPSVEMTGLGMSSMEGIALSSQV